MFGKFEYIDTLMFKWFIKPVFEMHGDKPESKVHSTLSYTYRINGSYCDQIASPSTVWTDIAKYFTMLQHTLYCICFCFFFTCAIHIHTYRQNTNVLWRFLFNNIFIFKFPLLRSHSVRSLCILVTILNYTIRMIFENLIFNATRQFDSYHTNSGKQWLNWF